MGAPLPGLGKKEGIQQYFLLLPWAQSWCCLTVTLKLIKTLIELGQFSVMGVLEHWNSVRSERGALVTSSKIAIYARYTGEGQNFKRGWGFQKRGDETTLLIMPPTSIYYEETGYLLWKSSASWFSYSWWNNEESHETRVLVVVLTSKCKLRIPSRRITPI